MNDRAKTTAWLMLVGCALVIGFSSGHYVGKHGLPTIGGIVAPVVPPAPVVKVTAATYFYEKDDGGVPSAVTKGINTLNDLGITATAVDDDVVTPAGKVPKQYEVSLPAARAAGLPALVVMAGDEVVRVVKSPTTEKEVTEAAK